MSKIFQIVDGKCHWLTPYASLTEIEGKFPVDCKFVEAPDYVFENWGYADTDEKGKEIPYEERFIKPVPPEGWLYDDKTGKFYPESEEKERLEKAQKAKQGENKILFAKYLEEHPLTWTDGKVYGVTMEDQTEIQLNISQYKIQVEAGVEEPKLEWHAIHEPCSSWSYEDLSELVVAISEYIYPWFTKMNNYKYEIFSATSIKELDAIVLDYSEE